MEALAQGLQVRAEPGLATLTPSFEARSPDSVSCAPSLVPFLVLWETIFQARKLRMHSLCRGHSEPNVGRGPAVPLLGMCPRLLLPEPQFPHLSHKAELGALVKWPGRPVGFLYCKTQRGWRSEAAA